MQISSTPARRTPRRVSALTRYLPNLSAARVSVPRPIIVGATRALHIGSRAAPWRLLWPVTTLGYLLLLTLFIAVLPEAVGFALTLERLANYAGLIALIVAIVHDIVGWRARSSAADETPLS